MKPTQLTRSPGPAHLRIILATGLLAPAASAGACGPSPESDSDSASDSGGETTQGPGDPNAPGQDCPDSFDPDAVYAVIQRPGTQSGVLFFADVRDPARECAFEFDTQDHGSSDNRVGSFAVQRGDGSLLRAARSQTTSDFDYGRLYIEHPDPMERDINGLWGPLVPNDELLVEDFGSGECNFGSFEEPFTLRMHGSSGELGYLCSGAYEMRAFDGRVLEDLHDRSSAEWFLSDGRAIGRAQEGPILFPSAEGADGIPMEVPPGVFEDISAVLEIDSVAMVASRDFVADENGVARLRLEDDRLVVDARYAVPEVDGTEQIVLDGEGNLTVFGSRTTTGGEDHQVVVRVQAGGNEIVSDVPEISSGELQDMPESGGALRVERLIFPR